MIDIAGIVKQALNKEIAAGGVRPVSGGDINDAYLVTLADGQKVFLKVNSPKNAAFFSAEQEGLAAIRKTNAIGVPEVLASGVFTGDGPAAGRSVAGRFAASRSKDCSFLIMDYLEAGPRRSDFWERFGRQLAAMHRAPTGEWTPGGKYGFTQNNFIGAGRQNNSICDSWIDFFREYRLEQQFKLAGQYFDSYGRKAMLSLFAWLIDPAVYVGHAEADLAMTELFGGFAPAFYGAYKEVSPLPAGYADRRELYNLYHLLNHLNLFGEGYYGEVMRIVRRFGKRGV